MVSSPEVTDDDEGISKGLIFFAMTPMFFFPVLSSSRVVVDGVAMVFVVMFPRRLGFVKEIGEFLQMKRARESVLRIYIMFETNSTLDYIND